MWTRVKMAQIAVTTPGSDHLSLFRRMQRSLISDDNSRRVGRPHVVKYVGGKTGVTSMLGLLLHIQTDSATTYNLISKW